MKFKPSFKLKVNTQLQRMNTNPQNTFQDTSTDDKNNTQEQILNTNPQNTYEDISTGNNIHQETKIS